MPIFDLRDAKPLDGYQKVQKRTQNVRTLSPASVPGMAPSSFGGSGGFQGAKINRLTMDFLSRSTSADQDLYGDNRRLRARARDLRLNNPFAKKFAAMVSQNIIGTAGILLQAKVRGINGKDTAQSTLINKRIEEEWKRWSRHGRPTADGRMSFIGVQRLAIQTCAIEGESLVKYVYGRQFNATGLALQLLDNDQLDDTLMMSGDNGSEIRMGVEVDQYRRPQAYHLWNGHPADIVYSRDDRARTRIAAEHIIHTAIWERPGQTRGYTWMSAAILPLNQQGRYEEAVIVAARFSAAKIAVIESAVAEGYDFSQDDDGDEGNPPGTASGTPAPLPDNSAPIGGETGDAWELPAGKHATLIDPRFPTANHKDFMKTMLRSVATGLLTSYPSLANDLEGVNFSSIRAGLLDERDSWRVLQQWFIESFLQPVFEKWLRMALLTVLSDIAPFFSMDMAEQMTWRARGWPWVDPMKDAQATILNLGNGLTTYARELANLGLDFEETMIERAAEQKFIAEQKLVMGTDISGDQGGKGVAAGDETEAAEAAGGDSKPAAKKP